MPSGCESCRLQSWQAVGRVLSPHCVPRRVAPVAQRPAREADPVQRVRHALQAHAPAAAPLRAHRHPQKVLLGQRLGQRLCNVHTSQARAGQTRPGGPQPASVLVFHGFGTAAAVRPGRGVRLAALPAAASCGRSLVRLCSSQRVQQQQQPVTSSPQSACPLSRPQILLPARSQARLRFCRENAQSPLLAAGSRA